jgi:hypothetical protein
MSLHDPQTDDARGDSKAGTFLLAAAVAVLVLGAVAAPLALFTIRSQYRDAAERERVEAEARVAEARQAEAAARLAAAAGGREPQPTPVQPPAKGASQAGGQKAEERAEPKLPEEKAVRDYVLDKNKGGPALQFVRWGPHRLAEKRNGSTVYPVAVRVCYKDKDAPDSVPLTDMIFFLEQGKVVSVHPNAGGDDWQRGDPD